MFCLLLSLVLDVIGKITFSIPFVSEVFDVVWAPLVGMLLHRMFKGKVVGRVSGIIVFIKELLAWK
jgi:hypothetical protein